MLALQLCSSRSKCSGRQEDVPHIVGSMLNMVRTAHVLQGTYTERGDALHIITVAPIALKTFFVGEGLVLEDFPVHTNLFEPEETQLSASTGLSDAADEHPIFAKRSLPLCVLFWPSSSLNSSPVLMNSLANLRNQCVHLLAMLREPLLLPLPLYPLESWISSTRASGVEVPLHSSPPGTIVHTHNEQTLCRVVVF